MYAGFLRIYPRDFRDRYGHEMVDVFERSYAESRGFGAAIVVARALAGAVGHGISERRRADGAHGMGRVWTMGAWQRDVRWAIRGLRRRPGFAAIAILTIALGIGSASAVFTVVDATVLEPLPYPAPDRLVSMWTTFEGQDGAFGLSMAEHFDFAERSRTLEALGSFGLGQATLTGLGSARRVSVAWTWGELYDVVGAGLHLGRFPYPEESQSGANPVALLTHDFWASAFGSDAAAVGRVIELSQVPVEVIGVLAPDTRLPNASADVWRPLAQSRADITDRSGHWLTAIGRLVPSATVEDLQAEIDATHIAWREEWAGIHSPGHPGHAFAANGAHETFFGELTTSARLLLGAIGALLLLACANVASMLLARAEARADEWAVQRALGARTGTVVRRQVVESLVLAGLGGAIALAATQPAVRLLVRWAPADIPRLDAVGVDARVLLFASIATAGSAVLFGTLPTLWSTTTSGGPTRGSIGASGQLRRLLSSLVVTQMAIAITLLSAAGLLLGSVRALAERPSGFQAEERIAFELGITAAAYPDAEDVRRFWVDMVAQVEGMPGVEDAAIARLLPLRDGLRREGVQVVGVTPEGESLPVAVTMASAGYFDVMGIPVVEGRELATTDRADAPFVGLVNESAARAYWPGQSPIGQFVNPLFVPDSAGPVMIVGVVGDVRAEGPRADVAPELVLSYDQVPNGIGYLRVGSVVARTSVDGREVLGRVPAAVEEIDPNVPVTGATLLTDVARDARARERFLAMVVGVFAALSLSLAALGTYGVVSFTVSRRLREFGLRRALGAPGASIVASILRRVATLTTAGVALGLLGALAAGSLLESLLFGVGTRETTALLTAPLLTAAAALAASIFPAAHASRADPLESLRDD